MDGKTVTHKVAIVCEACVQINTFDLELLFEAAD